MTNFDVKSFLTKQDSLGSILDNSLNKELHMLVLESVIALAYSQGRLDSLKDAQEDKG